MELPVHERLVLANQLMESAHQAEEPDDDDVSVAWETEIQARIRSIDEGNVVGHAYEDVRKEIAQVLSR